MAHYDDASMFSDLSSLDGSDEFGRKLLQHTKDAQLISNLQSQAFRKARPLSRAALNPNNLERNNLYNPPTYPIDQNHPPSATGSSASDPPLNPPRAWGRKGRPNHAWMRNIYVDDQNIAQSSPNIDWVDAANDHLESSAYVSPSQGRSHIDPTPLLVNQEDGHLDQWDPDQEFSAASLLASTPAIPSRTRLTIDQIRESEIHTSAHRPFPSAQRQAWQQTTSDTVSRRYGDIDAESAVPSRSASAPGFKPGISNKENIPLQPRHSPRALYKTAESSEPVAGITPRPAQRRADSMALLKRLSRTPSASPSPTSAKDTAAPNNRSLRSEAAWSNKYPKSSTRSLFQSNSPQAPEVVRGPETIQMSQGDSSLAPEVVEGPSHHPPEPLITPSRPADRNLPLKTPVVTGAWVDTPQTVRQQSNSLRPEDARKNAATLGPIAENSHQRTISEPNLPASALDAVLKDLRAGKRREEDDPTLGDSTIASLEEVMNPSADTTMRLDLPDVPSAQPRSLRTGRNEPVRARNRGDDQEQQDEKIDNAPTMQKERDQRQKWFALDGLKKRMNGTSAKRASEGQVGGNNALNDATASAVTSGSTSRPASSQESHPHTAGVHCVQCGRPSSVLRAAWNEYWGLFFRRDSHSLLGFRLTWLGLACTLFWAWLITELTLGSIFTPPLYATKMRGFGVDPDAPRFPYVLPTLVLRPLSPILTPLASLAAWLSKSVLGEQKYKYYPADPGGWGSAGTVKIGPPGPRSAYSTGNNAAHYVRWEDEQNTAQTWHAGEKAENTRNDENIAWEAGGEGSMLEDELI